MKLQIPSIPVPVIAALLGGVAGAITGVLVNIWFVRRQSKRELKSLILVFATELTLAFDRCVLYYKHAKEEGKISFSSLFDFTDPSILSRFATVNTEPDLVAAIMDLKSIYFQIRRHVEEASRFAVQAIRLAEGESEKAKLLEAGRHAQGVALAFFLGRDERYETTVNETTLILGAAKKIKPGKVVEELEDKFKKAKHEKSRLDALKAKQKKEEEKQNKS